MKLLILLVYGSVVVIGLSTFVHVTFASVMELTVTDVPTNPKHATMRLPAVTPFSVIESGLVVLNACCVPS